MQLGYKSNNAAKGQIQEMIIERLSFLVRNQEGYKVEIIMFRNFIM